MVGLLVAVLLPFVGAALLGAIAPARGARAGWLASAVIGASLVCVAVALPSRLEQATYVTILAWVPRLGLSFSILADGLSLTFALLITGIGAVVFTFAASYFDDRERTRRFFCYLLVFAGAMLGVVLSGNLISLFVFWELTSITSFLLIGFWHEREESRSGALQALVITTSGGLAMLAGFILVGITCNSFDIPVIIERRALLAASPWASTATLLIILGAVTKSAQFPFHLWLPSAMAAPTPVSAYLHAATMVKAGLYLVARLGPLLAPIPLWTPTLTVIGLVTMTWGSFLALRQTDLKALLAFSTVSQLGLILSLLAWNQAATTAAGLFHLLNHGLFKGALFLLVGVVEHETQSRDLTRLAPLGRHMPKIYALLALAALSMAGIPPMGGFISKELFLDATLHMPAALCAIALAGSALTVAYSFALAFGLGSRLPPRTPETLRGHDPGPALYGGPALLVAGALTFGLFPQALAGRLVGTAAGSAIGAHPHELHLALWHGFSPTLLASVAVVAIGALAYRYWWCRRPPQPPVLTATRVYDALLAGLERASRTITASYMSGLLWRYAALILAVPAIGVALVVAGGRLGPAGPWPAGSASLYDYLLIVIPIGSAIGAALARTRLAAILALGANGYSLATLFSLLGAPDLALTQIMVETVSVALFLAAFVFLPPYHPPAERRLRPAHLALAATVGTGAAVLIYYARGARVTQTIAGYFVENSVLQAGGHNVVNVILVDFRGLDTMGEITVLAVAALACYALIKLRPERNA